MKTPLLCLLSAFAWIGATAHADDLRLYTCTAKVNGASQSVQWAQSEIVSKHEPIGAQADIKSFQVDGETFLLQPSLGDDGQVSVSIEYGAASADSVVDASSALKMATLAPDTGGVNSATLQSASGQAVELTCGSRGAD